MNFANRMLDYQCIVVNNPVAGLGAFSCGMFYQLKLH
jgi:hypothetical protein